MILTWIIIHGKWLGRELGYRTANMKIDSSSTNLESWTYVINWGVRWKKLRWVGVYLPHLSTFESHFLDFDEDIYGETIEVVPLYKLRENRKFDTLPELAIQIWKDIESMKSMENHTRYIAIAGMSKNRVIGNNGKIPWHIPEDFKHFKDTTFGHPIIMGRKTFESIWRVLPGRENIILTRKDFTHEGITVIHSIEEVSSYLQKKNILKAFICGWTEIYREFFERALTDEVILSVIDMDISGDAHFPEFEKDFTLESEESREGFTIQNWIRKP